MAVNSGSSQRTERHRARNGFSDFKNRFTVATNYLQFTNTGRCKQARLFLKHAKVRKILKILWNNYYWHELTKIVDNLIVNTQF